VITTSYFALPNILANREVVPEFMPSYPSIDPIVERAAALLADSSARERMSADLAELVRPFLDTTASDTTAKILLDLVETHTMECETGR
jgi:lipid A disaccharide synthetase